MPAYGTDWDTLVANFKNYLRFERNLSANTIESYMRDVRQFREYIEEEQDIEPAAVTAEDIESYMSRLYDRRIRPASQARMLSGIKSFYRFLQISDVTEATPADMIDTPKTGRKLPDVLTVKEIDDILSAIDLSDPLGHRNKAMIEALYSCGLRVSELITLSFGDLFFDEGFIRVTGKGDKQRLVPVSNAARHNMEIYLDQRRTMKVDPKHADTVFLNRNGRKLTRVMVFTIIKHAVEKAGVRKQVSPHTFRHSFATHLLEGGASIRQVQEMLGHESILTTEIYTHLDRTHLRRSVEEHHPLKK